MSGYRAGIPSNAVIEAHARTHGKPYDIDEASDVRGVVAGLWMARAAEIGRPVTVRLAVIDGYAWYQSCSDKSGIWCDWHRIRGAQFMPLAYDGAPVEWHEDETARAVGK